MQAIKRLSFLLSDSKHEAFQEFLAGKERQVKQSLPSLLIMPIQRMCARCAALLAGTRMVAEGVFLAADRGTCC